MNPWHVVRKYDRELRERDIVAENYKLRARASTRNGNIYIYIYTSSQV